MDSVTNYRHELNSFPNKSTNCKYWNTYFIHHSTVRLFFASIEGSVLDKDFRSRLLNDEWEEMTEKNWVSTIGRISRNIQRRIVSYAIKYFFTMYTFLS